MVLLRFDRKFSSCTSNQYSSSKSDALDRNHRLAGAGAVVVAVAALPRLVPASTLVATPPRTAFVTHRAARSNVDDDVTRRISFVPSVHRAIVRPSVRARTRRTPRCFLTASNKRVRFPRNETDRNGVRDESTETSASRLVVAGVISRRLERGCPSVDRVAISRRVSLSPASRRLCVEKNPRVIL